MTHQSEQQLGKTLIEQLQTNKNYVQKNPSGSRGRLSPEA
jgi:hypothetical protein